MNHDNSLTEFLEPGEDPQMAFIKHMFRTINNSVIELASSVDKQNGRIEHLSHKIVRLETQVECKLDEIQRHFGSCPVDELREHAGQVDVAIERLKAMTEKKSSDKNSRPPNAPFISDRTTQLLILLAIAVLSSIGISVGIM